MFLASWAVEAVIANEALVAFKAYDDVVALLAQLAVPVKVPVNDPVNEPVLYEALNARKLLDNVAILALLLDMFVANEALEAR